MELSGLVKSATRRGKQQKLLTPTTFSLIHATDFADRYERQLVPLLKGGYIMLCDRFKFTAFAKDTVRGCSPEWVRKSTTSPHCGFDLLFRAPLSIRIGFYRGGHS